MKTVKRIETYHAKPEQVFKCLDDLGVMGMHMTQSSTMMMGGKLKLEFLTQNRIGQGSKYRWTGKMMWLAMDFTVEVTKWVANCEKIWETIGQSRIIIYSWYRMQLHVSPVNENDTQAELAISYERPTSLFYRVLSFFFAASYCKWCLIKMLGNAKRALEER